MSYSMKLHICMYASMYYSVIFPLFWPFLERVFLALFGIQCCYLMAGLPGFEFNAMQPACTTFSPTVLRRGGGEGKAFRHAIASLDNVTFSLLIYLYIYKHNYLVFVLVLWIVVWCLYCWDATQSRSIIVGAVSGWKKAVWLGRSSEKPSNTSRPHKFLYSIHFLLTNSLLKYIFVILNGLPGTHTSTYISESMLNLTGEAEWLWP